MENPATWSPATKTINDAISAWHSDTNLQWQSIAVYIRKRLFDANLLAESEYCLVHDESGNKEDELRQAVCRDAEEEMASILRARLIGPTSE